MGKGLQIEERGIHIAFCAGTGVLVYLDLVGHLIIRNSLPFIRHNSCSKQNHTSPSSFRLPSDFSNYHRPSPSSIMGGMSRPTEMFNQKDITDGAKLSSIGNGEFPEQAY